MTPTPSVHEETGTERAEASCGNKTFYCVGDQAMQHLAQRRCRASISGDTQKPSGYTPRHLALGSSI